MLVSLKVGLVMAAKEVRVAVAGVEVRSGRGHLGRHYGHSCTLRPAPEEYFLGGPYQRRAWLLAHSELLPRKDLLAEVGLLVVHCVFSLEPPASSQLDHRGAPLYRLSYTRTVPISPCS